MTKAEAKHIRGTPIEGLARRITGTKEKEELKDSTLEIIAAFDFGFVPSQVTVSASETRQVRPYETNNYFMSVQFNTESLKSTMSEYVSEGATPEEQIARYAESKRLIFQMIADKYAATENFIREKLKAQQAEDGLKN